MKRSHIISTLCCSAVTLVTSLAHAAILPLESRLGGLAYYDPNLDITWAAALDTDVQTWTTHTLLVGQLTLGGVSGWRLPSMDVNGDGVVVDCTGGGIAGCVDNEMGFLYWEEGITADAPGPFSNLDLVGGGIWSNTPDVVYPGNAWGFIFFYGGQESNPIDFNPTKNIINAGWAVYSGDVALPIPAAAWLFGSGLIGLLGVAKRKH